MVEKWQRFPLSIIDKRQDYKVMENTRETNQTSFGKQFKWFDAFA